MQSEIRVLLIEDDHALAIGTRYALCDEGLSVVYADSFARTKEIFSQGGRFDMILLDVMLPDADGFQVFEWIRRIDDTVPVIFLTALDDEGNVVRGLTLGASDYVTKPFRIKELTARIRANVLRKERTAVSPPGAGSAIYLDEDRYQLIKGTRSFDLTLSEFRLIRYLMKYPGQVLTRKQLIEMLWDAEESFVDDNTLSVYIRRIREKIDDKGEESYIRTVRGIGYSWAPKNKADV